MKKILSLLSLAALTIGLLGSCSKIDERISNLEKRVDGIESTSIASLQQQIDGISASINDLKAADAAIDGKASELKAAADAQQKLIDALKEADQALGQKDPELEERIATLEGQVTTIGGQIEALEEAGQAINTRIDTLSTYVDTQIGNTKDWAEETFATLGQYEKTADDLAALSVTVTGISTTLAGVQASIAGLDSKMDSIIDSAIQGKIADIRTELEGKITSLRTELEGKIASAISESETSIKLWINELLEGYYTAAQIDAKISALNTIVEAAKSTSRIKISGVVTDLTKLKTAVDTAKANIRSEYQTAIATAINEYDGEIRSAIKDSVIAVNGRIAALDTRVTDLEGRMQAIEGKVDKLTAMIQSVSITPAYSDGSVEAVDGILTLKCIVSPAEALIGMESLKDSLLLYADFVKVKTKATSAYMTIEVSEASVLDADQGAITLKADIKEYLPKGKDKALTVAVNIKNGISHFTTEFVPVTGPDIPEGALPGVFSVSATKKVYFSQGNLYWDGDSFELETNQYDVQSSWSTSHVSHFYWSKDASVAIEKTFSDPGAADGDVFFTNATTETAKSDFTVNDVTGKYRTLSADEWKYLFNNHSYKWASVNGVNGYVLAPDGFAGTLADSYTDDAALAADNLVFLPAAGARMNSNLAGQGSDGYYWSSVESFNKAKFCVWLGSSLVQHITYDRDFGISVRLVTEVK